MLVWSGVVCSCGASVVLSGVSYAMMTWLCILFLVASFSGNPLAMLVCWWRVPAAVSLPRWEPVLSQYHWNPHLSAFGLVALQLFRIPTARMGGPKIDLLRPARPLRHSCRRVAGCESGTIHSSSSPPMFQFSIIHTAPIGQFISAVTFPCVWIF